CSAPVYYHNYMMGQLFASQVHHAIARDVYAAADPDGVLYIGDKRIGEFMKKKVFEPGRTLDWKGLTKHATGEGLSPKAFARDFQGKYCSPPPLRGEGTNPPGLPATPAHPV